MGSKKKNTKVVQNKIINDYDKIHWICYVPLLMIACFVPLIVREKSINLMNSTQRMYWTGQAEVFDYFSYWKSQWLVALTVLTLALYGVLIATKMISFKKMWKYYIPMGIYALFVILSTVFSVDMYTALNGFIDMYQGMWVLLSYILITFLIINYVNSEIHIRWFLYAFVFVTIIEGIIGITQYFGFDIFNSSFGNWLIVPDSTLDSTLAFNFGKYTIYGTLFNSNYVGSFAALMLPMIVTYNFYADKIWARVLGKIALVLCVFIWIGCNSRAGYVAVLVEVIITVILLRKYLFKHWKISLSICIVGLVMLLGLNFFSNGRLVKQINRLNIFNEINSVNNSKNVLFKDIELGKNYFAIETNNEKICVEITDGKIDFLDEKNEKIDFDVEEIAEGKKYIMKDNKFSEYVFVRETNESLLFVQVYDKNIRFYLDEDSVKIIGNAWRTSEPKTVEVFKPLIGLERLGSDRGYEWGRSIPLLRQTIVLGKGPDNFIYVFPKDDYIGILNSKYLQPTTIVDKPHNMYLKIGIETGLISLIALLSLYVIYIISSFKIYMVDSNYKRERLLGLACVLSVVGYLIAGIFNDNVISVTPMFYIILGIGIVSNDMYKQL